MTLAPISSLLTPLLWLALAPGSADARSAAPADPGVTRLLQRVEEAIAAGDPSRYLTLLGVTADLARAETFAAETIRPGVTRVVVRERDRWALPGALPGDGYQLMVDVFVESGAHGRAASWRLDVRRRGSPGEEGRDDPDGLDWGIVGQERLTSVDGLHRLALNARRQYAVRHLTIRADDLELTMAGGSVFVAETDEGITALVLLGRGQMIFSPTPPTERGQVRIFAGADTLRTRFDAALVRMNPSEFARRVSPGSLTDRAVDARALRRADAIFREEVGKSFVLDLGDLSRDTWSLVPAYGDFLAEVRTDRFDTLTYARSGSEAEDITVFDRRRRRNIAVYASEHVLARRGRFYDEDALAEYDVLDYQVDASFSPGREWIEGRTRITLKIRAYALATLTLRLADSLVVHSVVSDRFGRLLTLRVRNQNSVIVSLPTSVPRDGVLTLDVSYSGRLPPQTTDREALTVLQGQSAAQAQQEAVTIPAEPSYLYSNRSYWYPQAQVSDYATATLRLDVPAEYDCVASGELVSQSSAPVDRGGRGVQASRKEYVFAATQPLRYLACLISRFVRVESTTVSVRGLAASPDAASSASTAPPVDPSQRAGVFYDNLHLVAEANPRQQGRGRELAARAADIVRFYSDLVGDSPYPSFTLALVEKDLPGGHSPAYFAALHQPPPTSPLTWANDPASFANYPEFFLAHEIAHQWWGQAVGWKNYHEQWLSEGFAQYFAALYAERLRGPRVFAGIVRRLSRWAIDESDEGPVYLGYRLGHLKGEGRVFRALVYNKGAAVLHMLRRLVGDDRFFQAVRRFYATWRFQKAGTDDLRQAFEAVTNRPLDRFFDRWIYNAALPHLTFSYQTSGPAGAREVRLRFEQADEPFDLPVTVTLHYDDGRAVDVIVPVTDRVSELRVPLSGTLQRVEVNRDEAALAHIRRN